MQKTPASVEKEIKTFIEDRLLLGQKKIAPEDSLLIGGALDSVAHLRLISFLEKTFGITVKIDDYDPDNFDSLTKIVRFVHRKIQ